MISAFRKSRRHPALSALGAAGALLMMSSAAAQADSRPPMIVVSSASPARGSVPTPKVAAAAGQSRAAGNGMCGPFDPNCAYRLQKILTSPHVLPIQVSGGVRFGENEAQAAVRISTQVLGIDVPVGDLNALMFDAVYVPEAGGFRVRFTLVDSDVLFFCTDDEGRTHAPIASLFQNCRPDGKFGIGGSVPQIQWDITTGRVIARWAEINAVLNLLRNGNGLDYLKHRLNAFAGASVDTVWYGDTPGANGGGKTILRANVGIMGMLRSKDNRWELRGLAGYRPNVTAWNDFAIETRAQILHHMLFSDKVMGDFGIDGHYQYNTAPHNSMGVFASDRERHSAYLGAMFGVTWN